MTWCAICTDEHPASALVLRPLGRDDAMVRVCTDCDAAPIIARDDSRGYLPPGGCFGTEPAIANLALALGVPKLNGKRPVVVATPGWIVVRVSNKDAHGQPRDRNEALATLAARPWFRALRHLGSTAKLHLFERPPLLREATTGDPLAAIEPYRVGGGR